MLVECRYPAFFYARCHLVHWGHACPFPQLLLNDFSTVSRTANVWMAKLIYTKFHEKWSFAIFGICFRTPWNGRSKMSLHAALLTQALWEYTYNFWHFCSHRLQGTEGVRIPVEPVSIHPYLPITGVFPRSSSSS